VWPCPPWAVSSIRPAAASVKPRGDSRDGRSSSRPGVATTAADGFLIADLGAHRVRVVDAAEDVAYIRGTSANDNAMF
jgi:hypothetical protein